MGVNKRCKKRDFPTVQSGSQEPPKEEQLRYNANPDMPSLPRLALCVLQLPDGTTLVEALVAVSRIPPVVLSWEAVSTFPYICYTHAKGRDINSLKR